MSAPPVRFYFDYISPNAYVAWTQIPVVARRHGLAVEPVPVLFAGLLTAHGRLGPAEIPIQMRWMWKNVLRKTKLLGVPFQPPAFHPFNPLLALRVSSLDMPGEDRARVIDALFRAVWADRLHISEPEVVVRLLDAAGLRGAALVARAQEQDAKTRLRGATDAAIARGVFGVPTVTVGDELFWGYDDFPFLERFMNGDDPVDSADVAAWAVPVHASAVRARARHE